MASPAPSRDSRIDTGIESAENGFLVRISHEGKNGYESKRFVATTRPQALMLAAKAMTGVFGGKKSGGKKKGGKRKLFASKSA